MHEATGSVAPGPSAVSGSLDAASSPSAAGGTTIAPIANPFVIPEVQALDQGEQTLQAEEAALQSAEAVLAREESQTKYDGLSPEAAAKLASESFPALVDQPAGGPPALPEGESISAYPSDYAAQVELGSGQHGLIESVAPMALETAPGKREPIDLSLQASDGSFSPTFSPSAVRIPKHLAEDASLTLSGVSLTPINERGEALQGSEGKLEGASVFYGASSTDTDTLVKPTVYGLAVASILRSKESPTTLRFHVGLPAGAKLEPAPEGSGAILVMQEGQAIATIVPPAAHDATGTTVAVSMNASGETLTVSLSHPLSEYRLPIAVDPEVIQDTNLQGASKPTNWHLMEGTGGFLVGGWGTTQQLTLNPTPPPAEHKPGETGVLGYKAQGVSKVYAASIEASAVSYGDTESSLRIAGKSPNEQEDTILLTTPGVARGYELFGLCAAEHATGTKTCMGGQGEPWQYAAAGNHVAADQAISCTSECQAENANYVAVASADVGVYQAPSEVPSVSFDTTDKEISSGNGWLANPLYKCTGSECPEGAAPRVWLGPDSGALAVQAHDPGVGVSSFSLASSTGSYELKRNFLEEGKCSGIMCFPSISEAITYNAAMPEGEMTLVAKASDAMGYNASAAIATVGVDAKPPKIQVGGALDGEEIGAGESKIEVSATDGEGTTPSAGVREIKAAIDGREIGAPQGSCSPGPCAATATWTIDAGNYATGKHELVITAIDNANNQRKEAYPFWVHAATPLAAGPGEVSPSSGELTLQATDAALGQGLGVSRSYGSRHLTAGAQGPLGRQWSLQLSGLQTLSELPEGSVVVNGAAGGQTLFDKSSSGEYESPRGDQNLKLEATKEGEKVTAYVLKDQKAGTSTTFEEPAGYAPTPTYATTFGSKGTGSGQFEAPLSVALDAEGNLWITDPGQDRVQELSKEHVFIRSIGAKGSGEGQMEGPWGVAVNKLSGLVYVSDPGNHRVDVFDERGGFIKSFTAPPAEAFGPIAGIAVDEHGNVWVADTSNNCIDEFSEDGNYEATLAPAAPHALLGPTDIAITGEDLYVSSDLSDEIDELKITGEFVREFSGQGEGNGVGGRPYALAVEPQSGNLFVADQGGSRVQELSPTGEFLTKFGAPGEHPEDLGKGPLGIVAGESRQLYIVDSERSVLDEWEVPEERAVFLPAISQGPLASATQTYSWQATEVEGHRFVEPTEELAPRPQSPESTGAEPKSVECKGRPKEAGSDFQQGCRALFFEYATNTEASGEKESEWGNYAGRLEKVIFAAYNPQTKTLEEKPVAQYAYDKQGRLRAEWDPRIEPALKTTYGYDEEGHVTAVSPPGQEPWILTYGQLPGDVSSGRLIKYTRPPASRKPNPGASLPLAGCNEHLCAVPTLSRSASLGLRMAVSTGAWSNSPLAYAFQWERCDTQGNACTPIPGAVNENYTPTAADIAHTLRAQVSATNADGSTSALSLPSAEVNVTAYAPPEEAAGRSVVEGPDGNIWFTTQSKARVGRITPSGEAKEWPLGTGVSAAYAITPGPEGDLWFAETMEPGISTISRIGRITTAGELKEYPLTAGSPDTLASGPEGDLWLTVAHWISHGNRMSFHPTIDRLTPSSGEVKEYGIEGESGEYGPLEAQPAITRGAEGDLYLTEPNADAIDRINPSSAEQKQFPFPAWMSARPCSAIVAGAEGDIFFALAGAVGKMTSAGAFSAYPLPEAEATHGGLPVSETPGGLSLGPEGDLWVMGYEGGGLFGLFGILPGTHNELFRLSPQGQVLGEYALPSHTESGQAAIGAAGDVYFTEGAEEKQLGKLALGPVAGSPAEAKPPEPGSTIEYGIPATGAQAARQGIRFQAGGFMMAIGMSVDPHGNLWVAGASGSLPSPGVVRELSPTGAQERQIATGECLPTGVSADESGEVFVSEILCERVQVFGEEGQLLRQFRSSKEGSVSFSFPSGVAVDSASGHLWVSDMGSDRVWELSKTGEYISYTGSEGAGSGQFKAPRQLAVDGSGDVWVADEDNNRVDELSSEGKWIEAIGYGVQDGQDKLETCTSACRAGIPGEGDGQLQKPIGVSVDSQGHVFVADSGDGRIEEYQASSGAYLGQYGQKGEGEGEFQEPQSIAFDPEGQLWVLDSATGKLSEYRIAGEAPAAPHALGEGEVARWGQEDDPVEGIAVFPPDEPQSWPATDYRRAGISYLDRKGRVVNAVAPSGAISTAEYNEDGEVERSLSADSRLRALEAGEKSAEAAERLSTESFYNLEGTELSETLGPEHAVRLAQAIGAHKAGEEVKARNRTTYGYDEGAPEGEQYGLETKVTQGIKLVEEGAKGEERTTTTSYSGQNGLGWKLRAPTSVTVDPKLTEGEKALSITHSTIYDERTGLTLETRGPDGQSGGSAHDAQSVYYTGEADSAHPACGEKPQWEGLPCETRPAKQPETKGLPPLEETFVAFYNLYDEPEKVEERFGSATRTKTTSYDSAGRELASEVSAAAGLQAPPKAKREYNPETGALEREISEGAQGTKVITSKLNTLGQLESYTDAAGGITDYEYDEDGRISKVFVDMEGENKESAKDAQTYDYNPITGALNELIDSAAGVFTASYDVEGNLESESYPNKMIASYTRNEAGEVTALTYTKPNCSEQTKGECTIYEDKLESGAHGEALKETSSLETLSYAYDQIGRLTEVQETPAGKGCTARLYAYDEESNRTSLVTRESSSPTCFTEGGNVEEHHYDDANRLTDPGVVYDALGNITQTPAADAGGQELRSAYYSDGQLQSQSQKEKVGESTIEKVLSYTYDPAGRTLQTTTKAPSETIATSHYAGPGSTPAWTSEGESYTLDIAGIDGSLTAIKKFGEPAVLQLHDLKGDIVGTCGVKEGEYTLTSTYDSTEFGVPSKDAPLPKSGLAWLGAAGVKAELASGVIAENGSSYVPEIGTVLQTEPIVPPGADAEGSYSGAPYVTHLTAADVGADLAWGAGAPGRELVRQEEIRRHKEEQEAHANEASEAGGGEPEGGRGADPKCKVKVALGRTISSTHTEWVYARGWGWCEGVKALPKGSELETCLFIEEEEAEYLEPFKLCAFQGSGFNPLRRHEAKPMRGLLYAHRHVRCAEGSAYAAWAWFWVPGMAHGLERWAKGWRCGDSTIRHLVEVGVIIAEGIPGIGTPG